MSRQLKKLGVVMDAQEFIKKDHDSSIVLIEEAKKRGYDIYGMEQKDLNLKNGKPYFKEIPLSEFELILMRKDPPVDMQYIYACMILALAERAGVKIINKPQSLLNFNEKLVISYFPELCAPTIVTHNSKDIEDFLSVHQEIIIKPLGFMGGKGIVKIKAGEKINITEFPVMAQKYIPEIKQGDKRIIMMHGKALPWAISRLPKPGSILANLAAGGSYQKAELTERDHVICNKISPFLKEQGILFAGLDVIGDYLTEINITSPTCLREIDHLFGVNTASVFFDGLS